MGFLIFGKAHTGRLYGYLHSADIGQVAYYMRVRMQMRACTKEGDCLLEGR